MAITLQPPHGTTDSDGQLVEIVVRGAAPGCRRVRVTINCGGEPVHRDVPVATGDGAFEVIFGLADGLRKAECRCNGRITVEAQCDTDPNDTAKADFTLPCDEPEPESKRAFVYAVKVLCGVQDDCGCACTAVRPGIYATEINVVNLTNEEVRLVPFVQPLILSGAAAGRAPARIQGRRIQEIVLPPHTATMIDCCAITEALLGAMPSMPVAFTTGFVELWSTDEVGVTAVYTATDRENHSLSLDVETIEGRVRHQRLSLEPPQLHPLDPTVAHG